MKINFKIKEKREERGLSQIKLSKLSGVCKSNIGAIELGIIKKPSFIDVFKISKALHVSIYELFEEKENEEI